VIFNSYVSLPEGTFLKNPSDLAPKKNEKKKTALSSPRHPSPPEAAGTCGSVVRDRFSIAVIYNVG